MRCDADYKSRRASHPGGKVQDTYEFDSVRGPHGFNRVRGSMPRNFLGLRAAPGAMHIATLPGSKLTASAVVIRTATVENSVVHCAALRTVAAVANKRH